MARELITKGTDQRSGWDSIWEGKKAINRMVVIGRKVYNKWWLKLLDPYMHVPSFCELGCGSSTLLSEVAKCADHVTGIDYSRQALQISEDYFKKNNITNYSFRLGNVMNLKSTVKYDVVWSQGLIEHFEEPGKIIKEHLRVTKPGGYAIISVPYRYSYQYPWYLATRSKLLQVFWPWTEQLFLSKRDMRRLLRQHCPNHKTFHFKSLIGFIVLFVKNDATL